MREIVKKACLVAAIACSGCQSVGPRAINQLHSHYNEAVGSVVDRQLLTNIVRLKYRENPIFLEINNITDSHDSGFDLGFKSAEWFPHATADRTKLVPTFIAKNYHRPTISYRPIRGKEFIKHLMTPVPLSVTLGMASSGWKLGRVFNTCVEKINGLENAPSASGPMPWNKPNYEKFYAMTELLSKLESANCVVIGKDPANEQRLIVRLRENVDAAEFKRMLGLDPNRSEFSFDSNFLKASGCDIVVRTRSLLGVLFYLSHAVEVPAADIERGVVQTTRDDGGAVFDWTQNASGTLIKIHCSATAPQNAFVSINHRGHWFYIDDGDLHSKSTFMFVSMLFDLQAGEASSADVAPMLTIPVR
jgi:hypothetical protein